MCQHKRVCVGCSIKIMMGDKRKSEDDRLNAIKTQGGSSVKASSRWQFCDKVEERERNNVI